MKKTIFFTLCLSAFITFSAAAKIWRVNNNSGVTADFTDLETAINSPNVLDGDTIHIEPSPNAYSSASGAILINKRLTILGNGYYLTENLNNQANTYNSVIDGLFFTHGSTGSAVSGCVVGSIAIGGPEPTVSIANLTFSNNLIGQIQIDNYAPISAVVRNNYISGAISVNIGFSTASMSVYNNYIGGGISFDYGFFGSGVGAVTGIVSNNIILGQVAAHSSIVKNNIFIHPNADGAAVFSSDPNLSNTNTINNNISIFSVLPSTGNNINNADINSLFVGLTDHTTDSQWQLKSGSPAIGAGANGEDCGMFGGANPYKLSGLPAIPSIYSLATGSSNTTTLPVTISVKSNN